MWQMEQQKMHNDSCENIQVNPTSGSRCSWLASKSCSASNLNIDQEGDRQWNHTCRSICEAQCKCSEWIFYPFWCKWPYAVNMTWTFCICLNRMRCIQEIVCSKSYFLSVLTFHIMSGAIQGRQAPSIMYSPKSILGLSSNFILWDMALRRMDPCSVFASRFTNGFKQCWVRIKRWQASSQ